MTPTETQIAWAAGLYEGEGSCSISKKWNQPSVQLGTTDLDVLETFAQIMGVGAIYEVKRKSQLGKKKQWLWYTGKCADVVTALEMLMPHLHSRRRDRAEEVLAVATTKSGQIRVRGRGISAEQRELLYELGLKERPNQVISLTEVNNG